MEIKVLSNILRANDQIAKANRALLDKHKVFCINLMSSPGAGKTTFILSMAEEFRGVLRVGVIEGDLSSSVDARTVARAGLPVVQINTGGGCHLEAGMVANALEGLPLDDIDILVIENVGNLICTANYDLGEHLKLVLSSTPEGHDKPVKYPNIFCVAHAVVINKIDLAPHVQFDVGFFSKAIRAVNEEAAIFLVSGKTGEGLDEWCRFVRGKVNPAP